MAQLNFSQAVQTARLQALVSAIGSAATLYLYTGTIPTSPDASATGTLLGSVSLASPFGTISGSVLTAAVPPQTTALQSGTPGYVRIVNSSGAAVVDLDVSTTSGAASITISNSIQAGAPVMLVSLTITEA